MKLYVFDADETLRRTLVPGQPCPYAPGEWALMPNVRERLARIPFGPDGPYLGVASNQDRVGWGLLSEAAARRLLEDMVEAATGGLRGARVELCPHLAHDGCACRKPRPGMLQRLLAHFRVAPHEAIFVGDAETDRQAAEAAGTHFAWARDFFGEVGVGGPRAP